MSYPWLTWRWFHRQLVWLSVLPIVATALTGAGYRVALDLLQYNKADVKWMMRIHQGTILGITSQTYTLINFLLFASSVLSGWKLFSWKKSKQRILTINKFFSFASLNKWHVGVAPLLLLLMIWAAVTGVTYRWARNVFEVPKDQIGWMLEYHQFKFTEGEFSMVSLGYAVVAGVGVVVGVVSGLAKHPVFRKYLRPTSSK